MAFEVCADGAVEDEDEVTIGCDVALSVDAVGEVACSRGCEGSALSGMADAIPW